LMVLLILSLMNLPYTNFQISRPYSIT
jgi:hypothetical protein